MIIHRLTLEGFKIFSDPLDLIFPEEGCMAILGSNESGKSTLLESIEFALYGLKGSRTDVVTWGEQEARLSLDFSTGSEKFTIHRVIGAETGHRARLIPWVDGEEDHAHTLTSIRDIQEKIEQLTGMDRDTFGKLVYIKQKDLDALRDLYRGQRELLINKVMGIEVFDIARKKADADISRCDKNIETKDVELTSLRNIVYQYEQKLSQSKALATEISALEVQVKDLRRKAEEANVTLSVYEWYRDTRVAQDLLTSLHEQLQSLTNDYSELEVLRKQRDLYRESLKKHSPEIARLETLRDRIKAQETKLEETKKGLGKLREKRLEREQKSGIKDTKLASLKEASKLKSKRLVYGVLSLVFSFSMVTGGLIWNTILSVLGLMFLPLSAYLLYSYMCLDRLATTGSEVLALLEQERQQELETETLEASLTRMVAENGFASGKEAENALEETLQRMIAETGQDSLQAIHALLASTEQRLLILESVNLREKAKLLTEQILGKEREMGGKLKAKPPKADSIEFTTEDYVAVKDKAIALNEQHQEVKGYMQRMSTLSEQLCRDLIGLKPQYERFQALQLEVTDLQNQREMLWEVNNQLAETSKELRSKVLPHARFLINQMLPTMTNGRYSDFEITEDLRFTVLSREAGGYKEREVFSGGTQDQFLVALRLAFTQSILDSRVMADKYCILMDECTASSDETRRQGIFEVLKATRSVFAQIFVVAHDDISDYTDHNIVLARNSMGHAEIRSKNW